MPHDFLLDERAQHKAITMDPAILDFINSPIKPVRRKHKNPD